MKTAIAVATLVSAASCASAQPSAGSIAFTGYATISNGNAFSFVTLEDLQAGQVIYFTDNGWLTTNGFRGASATAGSGLEQLIRFTVNSPITAGTVITTTANDPSWTWTRSGTIGTTSASYADLQLASSGDQITAFTSTNTGNPLLNPFFLLANLDWTGAYETSPSSNNSAQVPTSILPSICAVLLNHNPARRGQFNLNALSSGTRTEWLVAISNPANWTADNLTTPLSGGSIQVVPAPGAAALLGVGGLLASRRRR